MKQYWKGFLAILLLVFGAFKMSRNDDHDVEDVYDELGEALNSGVKKDKDAAINEAKRDHADATSTSGRKWVDKWLRRGK